MASLKMVKVEVLPPRMLCYRDAAAYLGIAEKTLRNRTGRHVINALPFKPKRVAGKPVFDRLELDRYCDSLSADGDCM